MANLHMLRQRVKACRTVHSMVAIVFGAVQTAPYQLCHTFARLLPSAQVYDILVMENSIDASLRVYCPYKDCSCLLERPEDDGGGAFECPSCHRVFCGSCGVAGWHTVSLVLLFDVPPCQPRAALLTSVR